MKNKIITSFLFLLLTQIGYSQLIGGSVKQDGRTFAEKPAFIIEGNANGYAKFELAVDVNGNVTGVKLIETNLKSTPAKYRLRNYVKNIKFQPGRYYPKFHHAIVKITMIRPK